MYELEPNPQGYHGESPAATGNGAGRLSAMGPDVSHGAAGADRANGADGTDGEDQAEHEIVFSQSLLAELAQAMGPAPRGLRLRCLLAGIGLLVGAWLAAALVALLALNLDSLMARGVVVLVLGLLVMCWLAVAALCALVVGAFSLSLAFTRRNW